MFSRLHACFGFLTSALIGEDAEISYGGDTKVNGRMLARFGCQVPVGKSHYVFGNRQGSREMVIGYEGYFHAPSHRTTIGSVT